MSSFDLPDDGLASFKMKRKLISQNAKLLARKHSIKKANLVDLQSPQSLQSRGKSRSSATQLFETPGGFGTRSRCDITPEARQALKTDQPQHLLSPFWCEMISLKSPRPNLGLFLDKQPKSNDSPLPIKLFEQFDGFKSCSPTVEAQIACRPGQHTETSWNNEFEEMWSTRVQETSISNYGSHELKSAHPDICQAKDNAQSPQKGTLKRLFIELDSDSEYHSDDAPDSSVSETKDAAKACYRTCQTTSIAPILTSEVILPLNPSPLNSLSENSRASSQVKDAKDDFHNDWHNEGHADKQAKGLNLGQDESRFVYQFNPLGYSCDQYAHHKAHHTVENCDEESSLAGYFRQSIDGSRPAQMAAKATNFVRSTSPLAAADDPSTEAQCTSRLWQSPVSQSTCGLWTRGETSSGRVKALKTSFRRPPFKNASTSTHEMTSILNTSALSRTNMHNQESLNILPRSLKIARRRFVQSKIPIASPGQKFSEKKCKIELMIRTSKPDATAISGTLRRKYSKSHIARHMSTRTVDYGNRHSEITFAQTSEDSLSSWNSSSTMMSDLELIMQSGIKLPSLELEVKQLRTRLRPDDHHWETSLQSNMTRWESKRRNVRKLENCGTRSKKKLQTNLQSLTIPSPSCRQTRHKNGSAHAYDHLGKNDPISPRRPRTSNELTFRLTPLTPILAHDPSSASPFCALPPASDSYLHQSTQDISGLLKTLRTPPRRSDLGRQRVVTPLDQHLEDFSSGKTKSYWSQSQTQSTPRRKTNRVVTPLGPNSQSANESPLMPGH